MAEHSMQKRRRGRETSARILEAAAELFAKRGYGSVPLREIAEAAGIRESSLYNHYHNKQHIFDSIIAECSARSAAYFQEAQITDASGQFTADEKTVSMYKNMTDEQFAAVATQVFEAIFTDEISVKLRRMLTIEQYRSERIAKLFRAFSFEDSISYQAQLFDAMIKAGSFIEADPYVLALEFFSPIFLIFYKYDGSPENLKEAKELFLRHIDHFNKIYGAKNKE
jgi:AcrR family transcriptional regulator